MKKGELKIRVQDFLNDMIGQWFGDNKLFEGVAKTILKANINKYDNVIDMLTDADGNVLVEDLLNNIGDSFIGNGIEMDLRKFNSLLPNRVLIFDKSDFNKLKETLLKG